MALILTVACGVPGSTHPSPGSRVTGPLGDTWTWDGSAWDREAVAGPSARHGGMLAYDAAHHVFVLFGGQGVNGASDETWTWDGSRWTEQSPAHKPAARRVAAMAYDPHQKVVVLYGGLVQNDAEGRVASDTWTWDGSDWTLVDTTDPGPGKRFGARMVTTDTGVILFGGSIDPNGLFSADVWTWQGGNRWVRIDSDPIVAPEGRNNAAVAWDTTDSSLFVYGGNGFDPENGGGAAGRLLGDAWSYKDGAWNRVRRSGPPALSQANALWDRHSRRVLLMFGMTSGETCPNPTNAVWAWDGASWSGLPDSHVPQRWGAAVAQDENGSALVFGGSDEPGCAK